MNYKKLYSKTLTRCLTSTDKTSYQLLSETPDTLQLVLNHLSCLSFSCRFLTTCALWFCLWQSRSGLTLLSENPTAKDALGTCGSLNKGPLMITGMKERSFAQEVLYLATGSLFLSCSPEVAPETGLFQPQHLKAASMPVLPLLPLQLGLCCRRRALRAVDLSGNNHLQCSYLDINML